jgi:hypothetical protein
MKYFFALLLTLMALLAHAQAPIAMDTRVFEMRIYYTEPGKLDDLIRRFQKHTRKLFIKHGMENIGYWVPVHNEQNRLIYVLAYPDMAARDKAWKAFGEDPVWKKVRTKSEKKGKIVSKVESIFMNATDYSPAIAASSDGKRVFELRIYTCPPNKLPDLNKRFREHTMKLFAKHGATNIVYWQTIEKDATVQPKLYYILSHPTEAGGAAMFQQFIKDPEWLKVKDESEKNGKIVEKIESIYMEALPFSLIK